MDAMCQFFGERTTERNNKKSKKCAWQLRVVKICMGWSKRSKSPSLRKIQYVGDVLDFLLYGPKSF